jgi:hypothetical protein
VADTAAQWRIAVGTGVLRLGVGSGLIALRGFGARVLGADHDDGFLPAVLAGLGARDSALGLAAFASTRPRASVGRQVKLQSAFDLVDASIVGGLVAARRIPRGRGWAVVGISLASAVADYALARRAERPAGLSLTG